MRPITDLQRRIAPFQVISDYQPAGDQPEAIEELAKRINADTNLSLVNGYPKDTPINLINAFDDIKNIELPSLMHIIIT